MRGQSADKILAISMLLHPKMILRASNPTNVFFSKLRPSLTVAMAQHCNPFLEHGQAGQGNSSPSQSPQPIQLGLFLRRRRSVTVTGPTLTNPVVFPKTPQSTGPSGKRAIGRTSNSDLRSKVMSVGEFSFKWSIRINSPSVNDRNFSKQSQLFENACNLIRGARPPLTV